MDAGGSARLPEVPHRALTVFEPFKLSETNASAVQPAEQAAPPLFVARRAEQEQLRCANILTM